MRVQVPATSANLGPGFDTLALALTLYDEVEAFLSPSGLSIEVSGEGAALAGAGENHLVVRAMRAAFAATGGQPPGLTLRCENRIPHGRGLGSSAAAIVSGVLAARALVEHGSAKLPDEAAFELATDLEGHPDPDRVRPVAHALRPARRRGAREAAASLAALPRASVAPLSPGAAAPLRSLMPPCIPRPRR